MDASQASTGPSAAGSPSKTAGSLSRSTSAGSSPSPVCSDQAPSTTSSPAKASPGAVASKAAPPLPEYVYPAPFQFSEGAPEFVVKNTFVDTLSETPQSLEGFFQQRGIVSCPPGAIGAPPGLKVAKSLHDCLFPEGDEAESAADAGPPAKISLADTFCASGLSDIDYPAPFTIQSALLGGMGSAPTSLEGFGAHSELGSGLGGPPGLGDDADTMMLLTAAMQSQFINTPLSSEIYEQSLLAAAEAGAYAAAMESSYFGMQSPHAQAARALPTKVVSIAEAIPEPALGTGELPTMGSLGHRLGNCKPCAFMHTKGCSNGVNCPFCHLCSPGERKRRQKQRINTANKMEAFGGAPVAALQAQQKKVSLWNSLQESGQAGAVPPPR